MRGTFRVSLARELYERALSEGLGRRGTQALYLVLRDVPGGSIPLSGPENRS